MSEQVQEYRGSVELVVRRGERFLCVTNRRWGGFSMPGGKIHQGEKPDEAGARELREETGLVARRLIYIGGSIIYAQPKDDDKRPWFCLAYEAVVDPIDEPKQMEEGTEPFWATPEQILREGLYHEYYGWLFDLLKVV